MARIPYTAAPEATPELQAPDDYQHEQASPDAFGAQAAEGVGALGEGLHKLADAQNETMVLGASNDLADFVSTRQQAFRSLQGQNAIDAAPQFKADLEAHEQEIAESMPTLNMKNMFLANSRRFVQGALDGAGEHIAGETVKLQDATAVGGIQATTNAAIANRNTPGALSQGISTVAAQTADYLFRIRGIRDPDAIHAGVQKSVSGLISDAVTTAMNDVGGDTLAEQQQALKNALAMRQQASTSSIPGSPGVPLLDAKTNDELGQKLAYRQWTLSQREERQEAISSANSRVTVTHQMANDTAMLESGVQIHGQLPTDAQIDAAYVNRPEEAADMKDRRDLLATMNNYIGGVAHATPQQIVDMERQAEPDPSKPDYARQVTIQHGLQLTINARNKALNDDPALYMIKTDPDIGRAWQAAQANPAAFTDYAHRVQVSLSTIGVPSEQQSLLPAPIANSLVQKLQGNPAGAPAMMQQMEHQYGAYWPQVWRDLVQRGGLSRDYQGVGIIDPENAGLLARALAEPGKVSPGADGGGSGAGGLGISQLVAPKSVTEVVNAIRLNPAVNHLVTSMVQSGIPQDQAVAAQRSIENLAYARMVYLGEQAPVAQAAAIKAFTGQYNFSLPGAPRVPAANFNTVSQNVAALQAGLLTGKPIGSPGQPAVEDVANAIFGHESNANPNAPTSAKGAVGFGQITPGTFDQFARAGENINNPADNERVSRRAIAHYYQKYHGDVARVATAYFSGEGNVASGDSATAWKQNHNDGNQTVSAYVNAIQRRLPPQGFDQTGGPTGADFVLALVANPHYITNPNADGVWLVDMRHRPVRYLDGSPVEVKFNAPPPPPPKGPAGPPGVPGSSERVGSWYLH